MRKLLLCLSSLFIFVGAAIASCEVKVDGVCVDTLEILSYKGISSEPATSPIGSARQYFDPISGKLKCSEDGSDYIDCIIETFDWADLTGDQSDILAAGFNWDGVDETVITGVNWDDFLRQGDIASTNWSEGTTLNMTGINWVDFARLEDLTGFEVTSNKVTSLSGSSTDTQYPSAKLVYDQLAGKQPVGSYLTSAIISLNGLTGATQTFATPGTTGTAPSWTSTGTSHTLNIPMANTSGVTAGLISKTEYDTFNGKQANLDLVKGTYTDGKYCTYTSSGTVLNCTSDGGAPGGSDTQVQFNDGGSFNGNSGMTFVKGTGTFTATNIVGSTSIKVGSTDVLTTSYVDRGDPSAYDYTVTSFTKDGAYHDLDLSSIVPAGAKAVILSVVVIHSAAGISANFRLNGNSNTITRSTVLSQVANVANRSTFTVSCDANRVIEYMADNTATWNTLSVVVVGWIK